MPVLPEGGGGHGMGPDRPPRVVVVLRVCSAARTKSGRYATRLAPEGLSSSFDICIAPRTKLVRCGATPTPRRPLTGEPKARGEGVYVAAPRHRWERPRADHR